MDEASEKMRPRAEASGMVLRARRKLAGWQGKSPEGSEEVGRLAGEAVAGVQHVEEEGELAGQARLAGAEVVQDDHSQLLGEVEHLQGAGRRQETARGGKKTLGNEARR